MQRRKTLDLAPAEKWKSPADSGDVRLSCFFPVDSEPMWCAVCCVSSNEIRCLITVSLCNISFFFINLLAYNRSRRFFFIFPPTLLILIDKSKYCVSILKQNTCNYKSLDK